MQSPPPPSSDPPPPSVSPPSGEAKYVEWEDRRKSGFFVALWRTWRDSVFYPDSFYGRLPFSGGLGNPLLYALIIGWVSYTIYEIIQWLFSGMMMGFLTNVIDDPEILDKLGIVGGVTFLNLIFSVIMAPFIIAALLFIVSGIYHLLGLIFGWTNRNFEATFRAVNYSVGPYLFVIAPLCGVFVGPIWALVLAIIGIKHMQQTTAGKASVIALLPLILCCCLIAILAMVFGAAIWAIIQGAMNGGYYYD
jgi:hypothetical protein